MRKLSEIIGIIKEIKNLKSDTDVARILGMKQSSFSERKQMDSIPYEPVILFCEKEGVSIEWLLLGNEPGSDSADKELAFINAWLKKHPDDKKVIHELIRRISGK